MMVGIRRNQSKWHTLKLSGMCMVAKIPILHFCLILTAMTALCLVLTRSYLAAILFNAFFAAAYSTLKRAKYVAILARSLMFSVCSLLFFPMSIHFFVSLMVFNYFTVASTESCRRWNSNIATACLKSVILCLIIAYIQTRIPHDATLFSREMLSLFPWYITYPGALMFLYLA